MSTPKSNKFSENQLFASEIERYMRKRDIPDWFRGISRFQCDASNRLFEALLYDGEQRSTHRVRACLTSIGLKPMISKDELKQLMKISRGSDLAFLWFLLETHYKSKGPDYSINEQILYSCIAHLDMVTTLRELDRLLPHNPPREKKPEKRTKKQVVVVKPQHLKQFRIPKNIVSPYLEPMKLPIIQPRCMQFKRPAHKVSLDEYEVYKDPSYVVQNESNRWFATYVPVEAKRIVSRILEEEIARVLKNMNKMSTEMADRAVLCQHHKRHVQTDVKQRQAHDDEARAKIKKYFDVDGRKERQTTERMLAQIERDVEMYLQKSRYDAERIRRRSDEKRGNEKIEILEGIDSIRYCDPNNADRGEQKEDENGNPSEGTVELGAQFRDDGNDWKSKDNFCPKPSIPSFCDILRQCKDYDCLFRGLCETSAKHKNSFSHGDQYFFMTNREHQPYYFDYQKIFNIEHSRPTTEQRVKLSFVKALNSEMSISPDINGHVDIDKAFEIGFKKQWSKSVSEYNSTCRCSAKRDAQKKTKEHDEEEVPLRFDREYFDPDDTDYMLFMLKRCFDHMKKNPKFVLASLPDAHKIPSLFYFMQDRYGKRYSVEERHELFSESLKILRALERLTKDAPMPRIEEFSTAPTVSYACRSYLLSKGEKVRQKYYDELDKIIMHKARIFWFSMRPYLFTSGPPRNTYFAYMPPRPDDLTRFRQWKPNEFMDANKEWNRRQRQNKRKL